MTEYVFKIYTDENGVNFKSPKDLQPSEETVTEILAACAAGLVEIFIKDISKHINDNPSAFIESAETMINNAEFLSGEIK